MKNIADKIHIGELIAISKVFHLNAYQMITYLEDGIMEVFDTKEDFIKKYGNEEKLEELDWCELNNGKIYLNKS